MFMFSLVAVLFLLRCSILQAAASLWESHFIRQCRSMIQDLRRQLPIAQMKDY